MTAEIALAGLVGFIVGLLVAVIALGGLVALAQNRKNNKE